MATGWRRAISAGVAARVVFWLVAAGGTALAQGAPQPDPCDAASAAVKAPYSVACSARSECLSTDQLEIKSSDSAARPLVSVCLLVGPTQKPALLKLDAQSAAASAPATLNYALAPRLRREAQSPPLGAVLRAEPRAVLPVRAVLVDNKGDRFMAEFSLDVSPMWTSGALPLAMGKPECTSPCGLRSRITLPLPELGPWKNANKVDAAKLQLVLGGVRLGGLTPEVSTVPGAGSLSYQLPPATATAEAQAAWAAVLRRALGDDPAFRVAVADDKGPVAEAETPLHLQPPRPERRYFATLLFGFLLATAVAAFGHGTQWRFLRDDDGVPETVVPRAERTLSLARCQMLWWTAVVAVSLFAIGHATGNWLALDESALVLMGVSLATGAGAMAARPARIDTLVKAWEAARAALGTGGTAQAVTDAEAALARLPLKSNGLFTDLLSDFEQGVGLHRVQSLLFTVGFGVVYGVQAFQGGTLPSLPATALALMGISGGAYVGFKFAAK